MTTHAVSDLARLKFLQALGRSGLPLSVWEQRFLADFRHSSRPSLWFTRRRRQAADRMRNAYGHVIGPSILSNIAPLPRLSVIRIAKSI